MWKRFRQETSFLPTFNRSQDIKKGKQKFEGKFTNRFLSTQIIEEELHLSDLKNATSNLAKKLRKRDSSVQKLQLCFLRWLMLEAGSSDLKHILREANKVADD
ncbi:uncharacterized protein LOC142167822 [Nicotiana tabacum]|uniref:Uncharacterized protein LOC142167822 n=1 Tax=Nicotiana tabacum TaxID=4097 RepID=A0AC58SGA2_TOBAC